jgi:hypothetical protein
MPGIIPENLPHEDTLLEHPKHATNASSRKISPEKSEPELLTLALMLVPLIPLVSFSSASHEND